MQEKLLFTRREAAETLSISVRKLDQLLALRALPSRRIGRRRLVSRSALEKFARDGQS
jgi:excisionase family DNA binding protein